MTPGEPGSYRIVRVAHAGPVMPTTAGTRSLRRGERVLTPLPARLKGRMRER